MPQPVTYRVTKSTIAVFGVLGGAVAAIGIAATATRGDWRPTVFCSLPLLCAIVWLSRYRLEVGDAQIAYRNWRGSRRIALTDISEVVFAGMPLRDREIPSTICVLRSASGGTISVNVKVFPREAALQLMRLRKGS